MDEKKEYVDISQICKMASQAQYFMEDDGARLKVHKFLPRNVYPWPNTYSLPGFVLCTAKMLPS